MNALSPGHQEPHLWALTELVGFSVREVAKRSGLSRNTLSSASIGKANDRTIARLRNLLESVVDELAAHAGALRPKIEPEPDQSFWKRHREHVHDAIKFVLDNHRPSVANLSPPRKIVAMIKEVVSEPIAEWRAFAKLKQYSPQKLRKTLAEAGVVRYRGRQKESGPLVWMLKPWREGMEPIEREDAELTAHQQRIRVRLSAALADGKPHPRGEVMGPLRAAGFARNLIYAAAADLGVVRSTTGFGGKKTTWQLPKENTDEVGG